MHEQKWIEILGARQHNLKNVNVRIPKAKLTVITGPSGSGKSSLAFDTLYAEGQRRYMESLSTYARQFLDKQEKPDLDDIKGISPTIAIEQKNHTKNSRSTVGTATEIYDYLRLVFSKMGTMYCPDTGEVVRKNVVRDISAELLGAYAQSRAYICFPVEFGAKSKVSDRRRLLGSILERGFTRARVETLDKKQKTIDFFDIQEELTQKSSDLYGKAGKDHKLLIVADRIILSDENRGRLEDAVVSSYRDGFGRCRIFVTSETSALVHEGRYTEYPSTGLGEKRYPELTPMLFSFNSPMGACENCKGFGNILKLDKNLVIPNPNLSISQGAIDPLTKPSSKHWLKQLIVFCQNEKVPMAIAWKNLPTKEQNKVWSGFGNFPGLEGLFQELEEDRYKVQVRVFLSRYRSPRMCEVCKGHRLRKEARSVLFHKKTLGDLTAKNIEELSDWFSALALTDSEKVIGKDVFPQIHARLNFLKRVGLEYLSLDRLAKTLSGGEAQRIALANQLGSRLTQTCYVLDEPSIGLHPRDTERLIEIMRDLTALRNTVVVVEHDPDIIACAEHLLDMGPDAGENGGEILYSGEAKNFLKKKVEKSLTYKYMSGEEAIPVPMRRRMDRFKDRSRRLSWLEVKGCRENNLKNVDLKIPIGMLSCVTGVSGSGKSSAIRRTLYPALAKIFLERVEEIGKFEKIVGFEEIRSVLMIDQDPIGRSPRSNPITFMKAFDEVRHLFSSTLEARKKRLHPGHFSFNVPGGRCEKCEGDGYTRVEMVFMEDIFLKCDDCEGKRYKKEILAIHYNNKNIDDVLNMTVNEGRRFFQGEGRLFQSLNVLAQVGLGYLKLGQPSNTLSGGESQRLKIARELSSTDHTGVVYVLDEPTTGLHFRDVKVLIQVLHQLVERGNTVIVIEHNTDVMKSSDWVIDFGHEGGHKGGQIIAQGTPEEVAKSGVGYTSGYLAKALKNSPKVSVPELLEL